MDFTTYIIIFTVAGLISVIALLGGLKRGEYRKGGFLSYYIGMLVLSASVIWSAFMIIIAFDSPAWISRGDFVAKTIIIALVILILGSWLVFRAPLNTELQDSVRKYRDL